MAKDDPPDPGAEAMRKAHAEKDGMAPDETSRPPTLAPTKRSGDGRPSGQPIRVPLSPWKWAAARGLKPLPGREIPPEYRHLFEPPEGMRTEENKEAAPPAQESGPSRQAAPAEVSRSEAPLSPAAERIYRGMVRRGKIREALSRDDLPEQ